MLASIVHKLILGFLSLSVALSAAEIPHQELRKNAHAIDVLVAQNFRNVGISVPEYTDDETFVRRAYLTAIGRIPTADEASSFLNAENPDKRALLVSHLYKTDGYRSHMTNWYYDIFTLRESYRRGPLRPSNSKLIDFIRDAAAENMAWDELCKQLLSTKGNVHNSPGAAGYYAKGDAADDHLSNTMRIFTGVRMECAQCHDDPFQEWEQMDFYNLKAFVDGPDGYTGKAPYYKTRNKLRALQVSDPQKYIHPKVGEIRRLHETLLTIAKHGTDEKRGQARTKLPQGYQYPDGKPGEFVYASTPFGGTASYKKMSTDYDSLEKFAEWMTSDKTQEFAITIATRMWERVMGISLTPTTGDYVKPDKTHFPRLIKHLAKLMKDYDYDLKAFQETLMLTRTFQFVSSSKDLKNGSKNALDGRRANRMSAEQIWDSLISLTVEKPDELPQRARYSPTLIYSGQVVGTKGEIAEKINQMSLEEYEEYVHQVYGDLVANKYPKPDVDLQTPQRKKNKKGTKLQLRRASEVPTPAGGFLKVFGQSDRSAAIDASSKEGTVSQALELLNGQVQKHIIHNKNSALNQALNKIKDNEERVELTFKVILSRSPDESEMELCLDIINNSKDKSAAFRNIIAGIIASQEFYFIK